MTHPNSLNEEFITKKTEKFYIGLFSGDIITIRDIYLLPKYNFVGQIFLYSNEILNSSETT